VVQGENLPLPPGQEIAVGIFLQVSGKVHLPQGGRVLKRGQCRPGKRCRSRGGRCRSVQMLLQGGDEVGQDGGIGRWRVIGAEDFPWRSAGVGGRDHGPGRLLVVPVVILIERRIVRCAPGGSGVAAERFEARPLFLLGNLQEEFEDQDIAIEQLFFEGGHVFVSPVQAILVQFAAEAVLEDLPVPAAVEDGHAFSRRQAHPEAPEKRAHLLVRGRRGDTGNRIAARVQGLDQPIYHGAAPRTHVALEDDEYGNAQLVAAALQEGEFPFEVCNFRRGGFFFVVLHRGNRSSQS